MGKEEHYFTCLFIRLNCSSLYSFSCLFYFSTVRCSAFFVCLLFVEVFVVVVDFCASCAIKILYTHIPQRILCGGNGNRDSPR